MPEFLYARPPAYPVEERKIRKLARARHAPGDRILRARMITASRRGLHTTAIATELGCHPQTVRERLARFNAEALDGPGDRPISGRPPRLAEDERSAIVAPA
jgi:transposase